MSPPPPPRLNLPPLSVVIVVLTVLFFRPVKAVYEIDYEDMVPATTDPNSLSDICYPVEDRPHCESTVLSMSPDIKNALNETTADNVIMRLVEAARRNTQAGLQAAAKLLQDPTKTADPAMKSALETCASSYEAAARGIAQVDHEFAKGGDLDEHNIVAGMSSVPENCQKCTEESMSKYTEENTKIIKSVRRLFRMYWYVSDYTVAHSKSEDPIDMGYVRAVCGKSVNATECENSVQEGAKLTSFKGSSEGLVVLKLSGIAMEETRKHAIEAIRATLVKSSWVVTCDDLDTDAGRYIHMAFDVELAVESTGDVKNVAKLMSHFFKIINRFKKCQADMKKDIQVDGTILNLQERLLIQAMNIEKLAKLYFSV